RLRDSAFDMQAYIEDIAKFDGQPVTIKGWLAGRRSSGKIHFLQIRDGSGFIQAVMSKAAVGDETFARADHLSQESAVIVHGTARADKRAPGGYEIDVTGLEVAGEAHDFPITARSTASTSSWTAGTCGSDRRGSRRSFACVTK